MKKRYLSQLIKLFTLEMVKKREYYYTLIYFSTILPKYYANIIKVFVCLFVFGLAAF